MCWDRTTSVVGPDGVVSKIYANVHPLGTSACCSTTSSRCSGVSSKLPFGRPDLTHVRGELCEPRTCVDHLHGSIDVQIDEAFQVALPIEPAPAIGDDE